MIPIRMKERMVNWKVKRLEPNLSSIGEMRMGLRGKTKSQERSALLMSNHSIKSSRRRRPRRNRMLSKESRSMPRK